MIVLILLFVVGLSTFLYGCALQEAQQGLLNKLAYSKFIVDHYKDILSRDYGVEL